MEKNIVRSLAITTSSVCNLECSYCFLCKEDHSKELDREIVDGLISGTYATNCFILCIFKEVYPWIFHPIFQFGTN